MRRETLLKCSAWAVHLYTASGAAAGIITLDFIAHRSFRAAIVVMAIALFIDSTDGPLARAAEVRGRLPMFDGSLLDNVVDYFTYVAVPAFFMLRAGIVNDDVRGLAVTCLVMLASGYGFCRTDAKTADHYFLGFPSYWNLAAFYLFCLKLPATTNEVLLAALAIMVFIPIKFIYPNRTVPLRRLTLTLAAIWAVVTAAMIPEAPAYNPVLLYVSLSFIIYYFVMSFGLYFHPTRIAARREHSLAGRSAST